jgi:hypothetical protein
MNQFAHMLIQTARPGKDRGLILVKHCMVCLLMIAAILVQGIQEGKITLDAPIGLAEGYSVILQIKKN